MWRSPCIAIIGLLAACSEHGQSNNSGCADLSLHDCRLTAGCKPDMCAGCICDLNYRGCIAESAQPDECPLLGCPSGVCCRDDQQCDGTGGICSKPGAPQGCGSCNPTPGDCTSDVTCMQQGPGSICEPVPCSCDGQMACVRGCIDDTTCDEGKRCNPGTARCEPKPCALEDDCPGATVCIAQQCVRPPCADDLDCDGFCVLGECFTRSLGECRPPVP